MRKELVPTCSKYTNTERHIVLTQTDREAASGGIEKHSGPTKYSRLSSRQNLLPKLADRGAQWTSSFKRRAVFIRLSLTARSYCIKARTHAAVWSAINVHGDAQLLLLTHTLGFSLCLSIFLAHAYSFARTERGAEKGLAAVMKDSDEGMVVKYTVDVIYLLMERTHHTDTLSFKFTLSRRTSGIGLEQKHTFTRPYGSNIIDHTRKYTQTRSNTFSPSVSNYNADSMGAKPKQSQLGTRFNNHIIIPHVFIYPLINCYWAAMPSSLTPARFLLGKAALAKIKKKRPSDVRCLLWTISIQIYCRLLWIMPVRIHWEVVFAFLFVYKYVCSGHCHINRVAGWGLVLCGTLQWGKAHNPENGSLGSHPFYMGLCYTHTHTHSHTLA